MLEAIIATGIIVTAVASALTLVAGAIKASKDSETSITAANLVREGVEVVRGLRDTNWLAGQPFATGLSGGGDGTDYSAILVFSPTANVWTLDYDAATTAADDGARVYVRAAAEGAAVAGLFLQGAAPPAGTSPTIYSRVVRTAPICDDGTTVEVEGADCTGTSSTQIGVRVSAEVRWSAAGGRIRTLTAQENLMDWR